MPASAGRMTPQYNRSFPGYGRGIDAGRHDDSQKSMLRDPVKGLGSQCWDLGPNRWGKGFRLERPPSVRGCPDPISETKKIKSASVVTNITTALCQISQAKPACENICGYRPKPELHQQYQCSMADKLPASHGSLQPQHSCDQHERDGEHGERDDVGRAMRRSLSLPAMHRIASHDIRTCEGIVSKRLGSPYRSGRSPHWIKSKNPKHPAVKREAEEYWGR
jgi:hypothetical protein